MHRDAPCFMVRPWAQHNTTETVLNNGWRLAAVGGGWRLAVLGSCPELKNDWGCSGQPSRPAPSAMGHRAAWGLQSPALVLWQITVCVCVCVCVSACGEEQY